MERNFLHDLPHSSFPQLSGSEACRDLHSFQCSGPSPHCHIYLCNVPKDKNQNVYIFFKIITPDVYDKRKPLM